MLNARFNCEVSATTSVNVEWGLPHQNDVDKICHHAELLPEDDSDFSKRWLSIKGLFSKEYLKLVGRVQDWPGSTYHQYVKEGFYDRSNNFEEVIKIGIESFGE